MLVRFFFSFFNFEEGLTLYFITFPLILVERASNSRLNRKFCYGAKLKSLPRKHRNEFLWHPQLDKILERLSVPRLALVPQTPVFLTDGIGIAYFVEEATDRRFLGDYRRGSSHDGAGGGSTRPRYAKMRAKAFRGLRFD